MMAAPIGKGQVEELLPPAGAVQDFVLLFVLYDHSAASGVEVFTWTP